jgi:hypothetical protein
MLDSKISTSKKYSLFATTFLLAAAIYTTPSFAEKEGNDDDVILTFSTVGDSRQDSR